MKGMNKKRIVSWMLLLTVLCTLASMLTGCRAQEEIPIPTVEEDIYIYDEDDIINDDVEDKLNKMLVELEEKTEVEFAIISTQSLLDRSIEEYANNLYNTLGIGKKDKDNGVLLLISRTDEKVRLEVGRGLEGFLVDSKCGRILDDYFVPYRENDEYTKATEMTVQAVLQVMAEEYEIEIQGLDEELSVEKQASKSMEGWKVALLLAIVILYIGFKFHFGDDDYYGGGYHGGYHGGSSSRGGFGGGFSGGGGASR